MTEYFWRTASDAEKIDALRREVADLREKLGAVAVTNEGRDIAAANRIHQLEKAVARLTARLSLL